MRAARHGATGTTERWDGTTLVRHGGTVAAYFTCNSSFIAAVKAAFHAPGHARGRMNAPAQPLLLYCFAPAGTGAHVFRRWSRLLPPGTIVRPIERPGHGKRMGECALRDCAALVDVLAADLAGDMHSRRWNTGPVRYAVFGHGASFGFGFGFGVALRLQALLGMPPAHCFVSDGLPPHHAHPACSTLSDRLRAMFAVADGHGGILDRADLVSLLLPLYRADMAALEGAVLDAGRMLDCPITSFSPMQASPASEPLGAWKTRTSTTFTRVMLRAPDARTHAPLNQVLEHLRALTPTEYTTA